MFFTDMGGIGVQEDDCPKYNLLKDTRELLKNNDFGIKIMVHKTIRVSHRLGYS